MKKILDLMEGQLRAAFSACGYDETFAKVVLSNRPDLCEYQCNGSMAALKSGDLSNQASKDYIFDVERFSSFEGNTGPYILYTIVRIKSILNKYREDGGQVDETAETKVILPPAGETEKALMLLMTRYSEVLENSFAETAPHKICQYVFELANAFNSFYHETKILSEGDEARKDSYIGLITLARRVLEACIDVLGFEAPDRM